MILTPGQAEGLGVADTTLRRWRARWKLKGVKDIDAQLLADEVRAMDGPRPELVESFARFTDDDGAVDEARLEAVLAALGLGAGGDDFQDYEDSAAIDGAGLVPQEFLEKLEKFKPGRLGKKAKAVTELNAARAQGAVTREKTIKALKEMGRLVDLREAEQVVDAFVRIRARALREGPASASADIAAELDLPPSKVRAVLEKYTKYIMERDEEALRLLEHRAEQLMDDKISETQQYRRRK